MKRRRLRASSLAEALVALSVFGLVAGLIAGVFVLSHRYTRISQQVSRAQREAVRCMQALSAEFCRGASSTFLPSSAINEVWFVSNRPLEAQTALAEFDEHGEILWQKWVGIWRQDDGSVFRSEVPLTGGSRPEPETPPPGRPASILTFSTLSSKRRLASAIHSFKVSVDGRVVSVELESETSNSGNPPTRYHLASSFLVP
ncbi:hypothetical protein ABS71_19020 [bacterium SCN 62-11]|nr:hypothetical protein [Candidatus Eremiobacteraeota bacterium]ODT58389.1 MAG: hypothetical protein ABS71_19020 [bacterium SCN 62-11]